jgi:hypothetical protein
LSGKHLYLLVSRNFIIWNAAEYFSVNQRVGLGSLEQLVPNSWCRYFAALLSSKCKMLIINSASQVEQLVS